jgi:hypothetical protein
LLAYLVKLVDGAVVSMDISFAAFISEFSLSSYLTLSSNSSICSSFSYYSYISLSFAMPDSLSPYTSVVIKAIYASISCTL